MSVSLARLDELIAESEQRVTEQAYRVMAMELDGEDATAARRTLKELESVLIEYRCARRLAAKARHLRVGRAALTHKNHRHLT